MASNQTGGADASSQSDHGRLRVKRACDPCKERKRRCDGMWPCSPCTRFDYSCLYQGKRKSSNIQRQISTHSPATSIGRETCKSHSSASGIPAVVTSGIEATTQKIAKINDRSMRTEANSGTGFAGLLATKLDFGQNKNPQPLAWNLGAREDQTGLHLAITQVISQEEMKRLADSYFEFLHKGFGFLNRQAVDMKIIERWAHSDIDDSQDAVLCGVAALGSLFSGGMQSPSEGSLVLLGKTILEAPSTISRPSHDQVSAWALRTIYLRCTAQPHVAWIASCTMGHTLEAVEKDNGGDFTASSTRPENRLASTDRLFWIARLINTWISNEAGRSKVEIKTIVPALPSSVPDDYLPEFLHLLQISESLDPDKDYVVHEFENGISQIFASEHNFDQLILSKANLAFAFYRRLRLVSSSTSQNTQDQILALGSAGLDAVQRMLIQRQPWWHVANVPFQFVCVLLIMDTKESLQHLNHALKTLELVLQCFPTQSLTEAIRSIGTLIQLSKRRKQEDIFLMDEALKARSWPFLPQQEQAILRSQESIQVQLDGTDFPDIPYLGDLTTFDWNNLMRMDIPVVEENRSI